MNDWWGYHGEVKGVLWNCNEEIMGIGNHATIPIKHAVSLAISLQAKSRTPRKMASWKCLIGRADCFSADMDALDFKCESSTAKYQSPSMNENQSMDWSGGNKSAMSAQWALYPQKKQISSTIYRSSTDPLPGSASSNISELLIRIIDEEVVPQQLDLEMVALCPLGYLLDLYLWL